MAKHCNIPQRVVPPGREGFLPIATPTHCNARQHTATWICLRRGDLLHLAQCITLHHTATHCNALQRTATHSGIMQHTAAHRNVKSPWARGPCYRLARCNTLQHTATHCFTVQHTVTHSKNTARWRLLGRGVPATVSRTATHGNTLQHTQHTAIQCSILQHIASTLQRIVSLSKGFVLPSCALQHNTTHCSNTVQHIASHCNTLQHTAAHCNAVQRNATHGTLQCGVFWVETLRYRLSHCNTPQHTTAQCNPPQKLYKQARKKPFRRST